MTQLNTERVMPQALDAEKAVLRDLLITNPMIPVIENILSSNDFYDERHKSVYQSIIQMHGRQLPVDLITLAEELKRMEILDKLGGIPFLAELTSSPFSVTKTDFYAQIIKQKSISRNLISLCVETVTDCFSESKDISDVIEELDIKLTHLVTNLQSSEALCMEEALHNTLTHIRKQHEEAQNGIQSCIPTHLNSMTESYGGGFQAPQLIVLGARPSMGKTQHALELAYSAGMNGHTILFCSLEMNTNQLIKRLLLRDERINEKHINNGGMTEEDFVFLDESAGAVRPAKIFFADSYQIRHLSHIKKEARRLKRKHSLKFLIVDYLGLIKTGSQFPMRTQEIAHITGELKSLAKELDIAVLLLSQLNRPVKGTEGKIPVMEDLRESGDIEQDADSVLLLHKPDFYDPEKVDNQGVEWKNRGMLIRAKYREGERNITFLFSHDDRYKKIFDYIPEDTKQEINSQQPLFSDEEEDGDKSRINIKSYIKK